MFSDTHGNSHAVKEIFRRNEDASVFVFLGDGEHDLDRMRKAYPEKEILTVKGNCDYSSESPDFDVFEAQGTRVFFTHGHNWGVRYSADRVFYKARETGARIALFGHTHCRYLEYIEGVYLLNPGSAAIPRDGKRPSYAYIDMTPKGIMCSHVDL